MRDRILAAMPPQTDVGSIGGTLAGNALSLAAIRADRHTEVFGEAVAKLVG